MFWRRYSAPRYGRAAAEAIFWRAFRPRVTPADKPFGRILVINIRGRDSGRDALARSSVQPFRFLAHTLRFAQRRAAVTSVETFQK
eukprot:6359290-Prymnesium_polylepis.1